MARRLDLETLKLKIHTLPAFPEVTRLVLDLLNDPDMSGDAVANVVSRDASLTAQILRLVNSVYFGLPHKVSDLRHAIMMIGFRWMRNIALSMSLFRLFSSVSSRTQAFRSFWRHSAVAAGLGRRIAAKNVALENDIAYVATLLHDVGKLALMRYAPREYLRIVDTATKNNLSFYDSERLCCDTHHGEIAAWLCQQWNLAEEIVLAVRNHHDPEVYRADVYAKVIYLANYICWLKGLTCEGSSETQRLDTSVWDRFGLSAEDFDEITNYADTETEMADIILHIAETGVWAGVDKIL
jgi:HD-like signal output (HDOD) protein